VLLYTDIPGPPPGTHSILTQVVAVGGLLVLLPGDAVVLVQVVVRPHLGHVLVDVALLHALDPGLQLARGNVAIFIPVDPVHYFTGRGEKSHEDHTPSQIRSSILMRTSFKWRHGQR